MNRERDGRETDTVPVGPSQAVPLAPHEACAT